MITLLQSQLYQRWSEVTLDDILCAQNVSSSPPPLHTHTYNAAAYLMRLLCFAIATAVIIMLCRWVVLDEVDRLLDLGFEQTILEVLSTIRGERLPGLKEKEVTIPCN
jgi:hypothetical protein